MSKCYEILNKKTYKKYSVRNVPFDSKFILINEKLNINKKLFNGCVIDDHCSICYEKIYDFESYCKLNCSHYFHKNCIEKWITNTSSNSCPLCRKEFEYTNLEYKTKNISYLDMKYNFSFKNIKITLDDKDYWFTKNDLNKLYNQTPIEWKSSYERVQNSNKRSNYLEPIFKINNFKISTWLRAHILFSGKEEFTTIKCNTKETHYYDIDTNNCYFKDNKFDYSVFKVIYNWVFNLMHKIDSEKKITYILKKNTKILNLLFDYISKKGLKEDEYKLMVCSILYFVNDKQIDYDYLSNLMNGQITRQQIIQFCNNVEEIMI